MIISAIFDEQTQTINVIFRASEDADLAVRAASALGDDEARIIGGPTMAQFAATSFMGRLFARDIGDPLNGEQRAQAERDDVEAMYGPN